jgi:FMN phosphatase YigB (HAD superfamily)
MIKNYEFITFDLYGTLVDTKSSIMEFFREISDGKIDNKNAENLFNKWNEANFKNINLKRISFKKSIIETLEPILRNINLYSKENIDLFIDRYSLPQPFPETLDVLKRLKHKAKLVIISNIDNDMINKIPLKSYLVFLMNIQIFLFVAYNDSQRLQQ